MKAGKQASKSLFVSALQSFLAPVSEAGPGRARGRCRGCDNGLHLAKLPVQAGWQHSSVTEAVNIVNTIITLLTLIPYGHELSVASCWTSLQVIISVIN